MVHFLCRQNFWYGKKFHTHDLKNHELWTLAVVQQFEFANETLG